MKSILSHRPILLLYISLTILCFSSMGNFIGNETTDAPGDTGSCATGCHYKMDGTGTVTLTNVPESYEPGEVYNMSLVIHDTDESNFPARRAGFQIVATDGTNNVQLGTFTDGSDTRITSNGRIADSPHKTFTGDMVSWAVEWTAPSTAVPDNITFYYAAISGDGDGLRDREPIGQDSEYRGQKMTTLLGSLATEFLSFEATLSPKNTVVLDWSVQAFSCRGFYIQRATQQEQVFENIAWIPAENTNNAHSIITYQFEDTAIKTGEKYYYRLQEEDWAGKLSASDIQSIFIPRQLTLNIYPNPASEVLEVQVNLVEAPIGKLQIINTNGQIMEELPLTADNEKHFLIPVQDYAAGLYWVQIFSDNALLTSQKFIKN